MSAPATTARVVLVLVLELAIRAAAQPPCAPCVRGDALIDHLGLQPVRAIAGELAGLALSDPLTPDQYARMIALRERTPALVRAGAVGDADLPAVAAALCHAETGPCVDATVHALHCAADRCRVDLPRRDPDHADLLEVPKGCHQYSTHHRSPRYGLGFDWGTGWQRSRYPSDGGAWSFGLEGRLQLARHLGAVARVDRVAGRDQATDANHDGRDDFSTGSITSISALAGPSLVLDSTRYEETTRFLRLDVLGGYLSSGSHPSERGPAAGIDLGYQISIVRFGLRVVQGFGDAQHATIALGHIGLVDGAVPVNADKADCGAEVAPRSSRLALGFDVVLAGYGFSHELGYLSSGVAIEMPWHVTHALDAVAHADVLLYPGYHRDRVIDQAVLAGVRIDHRHKLADTGFFTTLLAGYTHAIGVTPTSVGSGPIAEASLGWGGESSDGAAAVRLHARFGIGPDNLAYRAIFLSAGFELRFDPQSWLDRD